MLLKVLTLVLTAGVFPYTFTYEGRLYDSSGNVYNGQAEFVLKLYDVQEGGSPLWEESHTVDVKDGFFSIKVGDVNPLPEPFPSSAYLGIEVNSSGEMSPRLEVGSVPFSFISKKALSTERNILRKLSEAKVYLNKCVSDTNTCCFHSTPVYYSIPGYPALLTGNVGGDILISFSISFIALSATPAGETRGYGFRLYVDGNPVQASFRACTAVVPWGLCNVSLNYLLPGLPEGEHTFEVKYCAVNDNVTGEVRTYDYSFEVMEVP
jgi:hypothetical protein